MIHYSSLCYFMFASNILFLNWVIITDVSKLMHLVSKVSIIHKWLILWLMEDTNHITCSVTMHGVRNVKVRISFVSIWRFSKLGFCSISMCLSMKNKINGRVMCCRCIRILIGWIKESTQVLTWFDCNVWNLIWHSWS